MKDFYAIASTKGSGRQEAIPDIQLNEVETIFGKMDKIFVDRCTGDACVVPGSSVSSGAPLVGCSSLSRSRRRLDWAALLARVFAMDVT